MKDLRPHRAWFLALYAALLLLLGLDPLFDYARARFGQEQKELTSTRQQLAQNLKQLQDDAALAERLSRDIDANDVEKYLAPANRLQAAAQLETLALESRLSKFTYALSPEQPFREAAPGEETEGVVQSALSLQAEAPLDSDVYRFIDRLQLEFPGRLRLESLLIERLQNDAVAATNIRMAAELKWIANESNGMESR